MTAQLTKEEKTAIINNHQKNILLNKYNIEISVIEENAKETPDSNIITELNNQIQECDDKLAALEQELNSL